MTHRPRRPATIQREERTMAETVADFLIERLMEWGVSRIYGYPG
jgi:hypothetical protein